MHESLPAEGLMRPGRWRTPRTRRRVGRLMIGIGAVGALLAAVGTVVGWIFVGQVAGASDDSLEVTVQALDAVDDTIDLAETVLNSTIEAIDALDGTLRAVSQSFDNGTTAIDEVASLADTLAPSLSEAGTTVRTLETVGGQIDDTLGALSRIPFGPDYDPDRGLGDTFGRLATTLEELPAQLESTASSLREFTSDAGGLQSELDRFATEVADVSVDVQDTGTLVDRYRRSVADARDVAIESMDRLELNVTIMRVLLVIGGVTLLLAQIVPLWLGRSLLDEVADALRGPPGA